MHNANHGQFHGVLRQSLKGAICAKTPEDFFEDTKPKVYAVYRCDDPSIAQNAALFAIGWATPSGSQSASNALLNNKGFLKTKYSDDRMTYAEYDAPKEARVWSVDAMFRALKAFSRFEEALTPKKGSSCSQFAVYCYQAAAIKKYLGDLKIDGNQLQRIKMAGGFAKLKSSAQDGQQEALQLIELVEQAEKVFASKQIPSALMTHAKVVHVGSLLEQLRQDNSGFTKVGCLVPSNDFKKAKFAPGEPTNWEDARRAAGWF